MPPKTRPNQNIKLVSSTWAVDVSVQYRTYNALARHSRPGNTIANWPHISETKPFFASVTYSLIILSLSMICFTVSLSVPL